MAPPPVRRPQRAPGAAELLAQPHASAAAVMMMLVFLILLWRMAVMNTLASHMLRGWAARRLGEL